MVGLDLAISVLLQVAQGAEQELRLKH